MGLFLLPLGLLACSEPDEGDTGGTTPADTAADTDDTEVVGDTDDTGGGDDSAGDTGEDDEDAEEEALYEAFYDLATVQRVDLTLSEDAIAALAADPFTYVSGTFQHGATVVEEVGIRLKGSSTYQTWEGKPAFKVKFNAFVAGQRYATLERATFNNMTGDAAQAREVIAYRLWRDAGMVVPRANYAQVYVNGELYGLYTNLEAMDDHLLERHYASDEGDLWEGNDYADFTREGLQHFELVSGEGNESMLLAAYQAVYEDDFYAAADTIIDMDQFLDFWAWSIAIGNKDGYPYTLNDYFIYGDPADVRFDFTPWGMDESWDTGMRWDAIGGAVAVNCYYDEACLQDLNVHVGDALTAYEGMDVSTLAEEVFAVSESAVLDDPRRPSWTPQQVSGARTTLTYRLEQWPARVRTQMGI